MRSARPVDCAGPFLFGAGRSVMVGGRALISGTFVASYPIGDCGWKQIGFGRRAGAFATIRTLKRRFGNWCVVCDLVPPPEGTRGSLASCFKKISDWWFFYPIMKRQLRPVGGVGAAGFGIGPLVSRDYYVNVRPSVTHGAGVRLSDTDEALSLGRRGLFV